MTELKEFLITEESIENMADANELVESLQNGKTLQELFGFTDDTVLKFYDAATKILEQKRYEEAKNAFIFLTTLSPYLSELWQCLGTCYQLNQEHDNALYAFSVAYSLEGRKIFPYVMAAQCCLEIKNYEKALQILSIAEQHAKDNPDEETSEKLLQDAKAAKNYVLTQQRQEVR